VPLVFGVIALVCLAVIVLLVRIIARRGKPRTLGLAIGMVVGGVLATFLSAYTSIFYEKPSWTVAATAAAWLAVLAMTLLVARDVRWRAPGVLAIVGLLITAEIAFATAAILFPGFGAVFPHETAARQIGEAYGFTSLLPANERMTLDGKPVNTLDPPLEGLQVAYERFGLYELNAEDPDTQELAELVAVDSTPFWGARPIPDDSVVRHPTLDGVTGVAVEYSYAPKGETVGESATPTVAFLAFEREGTQVRLFSESVQQLVDGDWKPLPNLSVDELIKIAKSMQPVE